MNTTDYAGGAGGRGGGAGRCRDTHGSPSSADRPANRGAGDSAGGPLHTQAVRPGTEAARPCARAVQG